jgi:hypothetical protein
MGDTRRVEFFDRKNEMMLDRLLAADFQRRIGGELNEKQTVRLQKTVQHYMGEVFDNNSGKSIQFLNKEVLTSVVPDYMAYLRRSSAPNLETEMPVAIRSDVNTRFGQLQNERQEAHQAQPAAPDFRISLEMEGATPLSRFEEIKRIREAEAAREAETSAAMAAARAAGPSQELAIVQRDSSLGRFIDSADDFRTSSAASNERDQLSLIMREAERAATGRTTTEIVDLPDPRRILLGDNKTLPENARNRGIASANPTTAAPERIREKPILAQDVLRPQDDIVSYKEIENNLYIYSADRDWVNNTVENRYNFSVTFDPANNSQSFGYNTATNIKFKNIVRIEFVKAIMSTESFDVITTSSSTAGTPTPGLNTSILSFPYLQVRIPELNVNGYGTNDGMNNAFAAISYDAYWASDSTAANRGYARMIPKFLKCQKVYYPTPLATLQKLTFQIQRPDGTSVSTSSDTLTVSMVLMPNNLATTTFYRATGSATYEWIWIQTSTWFNQFMVSQGDRIVLKAVNFNSALLTYAGVQDLINYLTQPQGLLVSAIGRCTGASNGYLDGGNTAGYANGIIVRNSFQDPTLGLTTVNTWVTNYVATLATFANASASIIITPVVDGSVTLTGMTAGLSYTAGMQVLVTGVTTPADNFTGVIVSYSTTTMVVGSIANVNGSGFGAADTYTVRAGLIPSAGRLININHQVQIIMRVITREMDSAAKLRPDNLQA